jgi:hypothetical protein
MMVVSVSVAATVRMPVSMPFCGIRAIVFQSMLMHVFVVIATAIMGRHLLRILLLLLIQLRSLIQDEFLIVRFMPIMLRISKLIMIVNQA